MRGQSGKKALAAAFAASGVLAFPTPLTEAACRALQQLDTRKYKVLSYPPMPASPESLPPL